MGTATCTVTLTNFVTFTRMVAGTESPARRDLWNGTVRNVPLLYESETGPCRGSLEFVSPEGVKLNVAFQFNSSTDKSLNTYSFNFYGFRCRHVSGTLTVTDLSIPTLTVLKDTTWNLPPVNTGFLPVRRCQLASYYIENGRRVNVESSPSDDIWRANSDSNLRVGLIVNPQWYNFLADNYSTKNEGETASYTRVRASLEPWNYEIKPRITQDNNLIYILRSGDVLRFRVTSHLYQRWEVTTMCPRVWVSPACGTTRTITDITTDNPCTFTSDYLIAEIAPNV